MKVVGIVARLLDEVKSENFSDGDIDDNLQKQTCAEVSAKTKDGEAFRDWVASFVLLAQVSFAVVHVASRQVRVDVPCIVVFFLH